MSGMRRGPAGRRGISLVEVMVAVTLLGLLATVHSAVTMQYALRNRAVAVGVDRATALSTAVDRFATLPYDSLAVLAARNGGCTTINTITRYIHTRCISTSNPTQAILRVQIIIRPENPILRPDTVSVDRSLPPTGSIFS